MSNHRAPSRDIALSFAGLGRVKHIQSGGWWKDADGRWTRAGPGVRQFFLQHTSIQEWLGWMDLNRITPGMCSSTSSEFNRQLIVLILPGEIHLAGLKERTIAWSLTGIPEAIPYFIRVPSLAPTQSVDNCSSIVCRSRDIAKPADFVVAAFEGSAESVW